MTARFVLSVLVTLVLASCGSGGDEPDPVFEALQEQKPGVLELFLRTNSGLPNMSDAPVASAVKAGTNPTTTLTAGVPFVLLLSAVRGNRFVDSDLDAHADPDTDVSGPQDGRDRGGGNQFDVSVTLDVQLGPPTNLPGTGEVPFSQLPIWNGSNERAIIDRAQQIGVPIEDIALPAGFNLAVYLNRNILTSTPFGMVSPDGRPQDDMFILGWKPSKNQLVQAGDVGMIVHAEATAQFTNSPLGVTSADYSVAGSAGGTLNLRIREASGLPLVATAPSAAAVRADTDEIVTVVAGLAYVLELEVVPGSAGFDLHRDPEYAGPTQSGLDRGGGNEANVTLTADRQLGPVENLPSTGIFPYSALPAYTGSNERAIFDAANAAGIDPLSVSLPAGFNIAIFLNRNIFSSDFAGTASPDTRDDATVVLASFQAELGAEVTPALAGDSVRFTASVLDRAGNLAGDAASLAVTAPQGPVLDLTLRTQSALVSLADAPAASVVLRDTSAVGSVAAGAPFAMTLQVTPGSTAIDFHLDPEWMDETPPQDGLVRGGGNEARFLLTADRQLGSATTLPGMGAPPYDALPAYSGSNERAIIDAAIAMAVDPTTIALPAGFNIAVLFNRSVLTSDLADVPSTDARNPSVTFLGGYQLGLLQAPEAGLLGDTITFSASLEDQLGSIGIGLASVSVRAAQPPALDLRLHTDSGIASLVDAPTTDLVDAASMDLGGTLPVATACTLLIDVTPGDGLLDAHWDPEYSLSTPPQDGLARGGGNELNVQLFCDQQLGPATNLPATGVAPYDALPAYAGTNERAIVDAAIAMGVDPTTIALPAGFNVAVLLNRNVLTTDAAGVPSTDRRMATASFTLAYGLPAIQGFDAALAGGMATFSCVITDALGGAGMDSEVVQVP